VSGGFDEVYVDTRRQLRGVAETLIAGPQYRTAGTIRLAVRPAGFAGVAIPLAVHGTELVWPNGAAALTGPVNTLADAAGVDAGPPNGVYDIVDPLPTDAALDIDEVAADWLHRSHYAHGHPQERFARRLRIRRAVDCAHRPVLERAVRSAVPPRSRTRCRRTYGAHRRFRRTGQTAVVMRPFRGLALIAAGRFAQPIWWEQADLPQR
jgi:hypothetical protein